MRKQLLSIIFILCVCRATALAGEKAPVADANSTVSREDLEIIALMDILENMDLAQALDVVKDMDILYEVDENENN